MKDDPKTKSRGHFAIAGCAFILLLALYLLSVGPLARLFDDGYVSYETLVGIYAPVVWIADRWPAFMEALDWYISLWSS